MAYLICANGRSREIEPENGRDFSLEELQGYIGGLIELVRMGKTLMVVHEEGKLRNLPVNVGATFLYQSVFGPCDVILGDVVVCRNREVQ